MTNVKKLFKTQILLFKIFGFVLQYERNFKGFCQKVWALWSFYAVAFGTILHIIFMLEEKRNVEDIANASSNTLTAFESMAKFAVVYLYGKKIWEFILVVDRMVNGYLVGNFDSSF